MAPLAACFIQSLVKSSRATLVYLAIEKVRQVLSTSNRPHFQNNFLYRRHRDYTESRTRNRKYDLSVELWTFVALASSTISLLKLWRLRHCLVVRSQ